MGLMPWLNSISRQGEECHGKVWKALCPLWRGLGRCLCLSHPSPFTVGLRRAGSPADPGRVWGVADTGHSLLGCRVPVPPWRRQISR